MKNPISTHILFYLNMWQKLLSSHALTK